MMVGRNAAAAKNERAKNYFCPKCGAFPKSNCRAMAHNGKWTAVRSHGVRLLLYKIDKGKAPFVCCANPCLSDRPSKIKSYDDGRVECHLDDIEPEYRNWGGQD